MKLLIFTFICIVQGYVVTTNVDNYIKKCGSSYVTEISYDISNINKKINNIIDRSYTPNIIKESGLNEIIIVDRSDDFNGLFCPPSTIVIVATNDDIHETTLHHEIMHAIDYVSSYSHSEEWDMLNKFGYVDDAINSNIELRQGFITKYGMTNKKEDMATMYEEFMMKTYSKLNNAYYDKTINEKFKLLFKKLIDFHGDFEEIIKNRNEQENYIYPELNNENRINIKFETVHNCMDYANDVGFIFYNIIQLQKTYENIVSSDINNWLVAYSGHDNKGYMTSFEIRRNVACTSDTNGYNRRNVVSGNILQTLHMLDLKNIKYTIKVNHYDKVRVDGMITLYY
jgi:hypothetical protein